MPAAELILQTLNDAGTYHCDVLRLDLIDPVIGGNKWFKLKYNLDSAKRKKSACIVTAGGPHSNHLAATAEACRRNGIHSVGLIRGAEQITPTLQAAASAGMELRFLSKQQYADASRQDFNSQLRDFDNCHFIPEGGGNAEGLKGCMEILNPDWKYDIVFCACGTGTTFAGLVAAPGNHTVIGISVLKGENDLPRKVNELLIASGISKGSVAGNDALEQPFTKRHCISNAYAFSGYAKFDEELIRFKRDFESRQLMTLDHIYTVKLFYAVTDLLDKKWPPPDSRILVIHSGGLQGNAAFEKRYQLRPIL